MSTDDIFASLGGSLMRDILGTDLNVGTSNEIDILSSLEAELDASIPTTTPGTTNNLLPHQNLNNSSKSNLPPGFAQNQGALSSSSAAQLVVSHQQQQQTKRKVLQSSTAQETQRQSNSTANWGYGFDVSAAADFLKGDAERKKEQEEDREIRRQMEMVMYDEEDYDIRQDPSSFSVSSMLPKQNTKSASGPPPGLNNAATQNKIIPPPGVHAPSVQIQPNTSNNNVVPPPVPHKNDQTAAALPSFLRDKLSNQVLNPAQPVPVPPPPHHNIPPHLLHHPPHHMQRPQPPHPGFHPPHLLHAPHPPNGLLPPPHGALPPPHLAPPSAGPPAHLLYQPQQPKPSRFFFFNPHPNAQPVPASAIPSALMTARDLSYVIHSMLRPLAVLQSDPQEDYYYLEFHRRLHQSHHVHAVPPLPHPTPPTSSTKTDDNDASDDTKELSSDAVSGRKAEALFRLKVEMRAKDWKGDKQVLGHVVKSNVHRPRALLDIPKANSLNEEKEENDESNNESSPVTDEDSAKARANLWKARKLTDSAYLLFLEERTSELKKMIMENLTIDDTTAADVNLSSTLLSLSKGRDLVSRCLERSFRSTRDFSEEKAILTVFDVYQCLPSIFSSLFVHPVRTKMLGEERLLKVSISYILLASKNISKEVWEEYGFKSEEECSSFKLKHFLNCLNCVIKVQAKNKNINMKTMLSSQARAEAMHALISEGEDICSYFTNHRVNTSQADEWKVSEENFLNILSKCVNE